MIKVLIVEDSRVVSEHLNYILSQDPQIRVIGNVSNGKAAIEFVKRQKPDVITMDIVMPIMDGLEATRIIMSTNPIPILIVTASKNSNEVLTSMEALAAGAIAIMEKPSGLGHPQEQERIDKLITMVKLMSEVKVVRRRVRIEAKPSSNTIRIKNENVLPEVNGFGIVAIGVSSGGPPVLQKIFSTITEKFPLPIIVVQHIAEGFLSGLVSWLAGTTKIPIRIAVDNELLIRGNIYFAPDNHQLEVTRNGKVKLIGCERRNGICPSVAHLFSSVAAEYGKSAIGIILTGMGSDGATELKLLRDTGALTIAQDKESSLIYGMPNVAAQLDAAKFILSTEDIGHFLSNIEREYIKR